MNVRSEIFEVIKELPGITNKQIIDYMPHVPRGSIASSINRMLTAGEIIRKDVPNPEFTGKRGSHRFVTAYEVNLDGRPPQIKRHAKRDLKSAEDAGTIASLRMQKEQLEQRIVELEAWKKDAITRHPDLAIDPIVIDARKIVASVFRKQNDNGKEHAALTGQLDHTPIMVATLAALEHAA